MNRKLSKMLILTSVVLIAGACNRTSPPAQPLPANQTSGAPVQNAEQHDFNKLIEFAAFNPAFRFSAEVPDGLVAEYVPGIESINIFDPADTASASLDRSQIFIRYFEAGSFLTLPTVDILKREVRTVGSHDAVYYQIRKKDGVVNFPQQPAWRNQTHGLIDIRFAKTNPSLFYVIAKNPVLDDKIFDNFIRSLSFHNDQSGWTWPITDATKLVTKKPFGIQVYPGNSPVSPERFSGYHTGADFESPQGYENSEVGVSTVCGGVLELKQKATGYGGIMVQSCLYQDQPVTVVYGHLALASIDYEAGKYLPPGEPFAHLGAGGSADTDGERKHLHLGIHKGITIDLRGYAQTESELQNWVDPFTILQ